jgi:magnesium-protoporphyrin O-methyltransferase
MTQPVSAPGIPPRPEVQRYFEEQGFERWRRIYVETGGSAFQRPVRSGHERTIATALSWLGASQGLAGKTIWDAGCGAGSLSLPLAQAGAAVHAVDISTKMIELLGRRAAAIPGLGRRLRVQAADLSTIHGRYDAVACLDVFARYPLPQVLGMLRHLAAAAQGRLLVSFAPRTRLDGVLGRIGRIVSRRAGAPALHTHREEVIVRAMEACGRAVVRRAVISAPLRFYFCTLLELGWRGERVP